MSNSIIIKEITSVNFYDLSPKFNTRMHTHNEWEIFYIDSGEVTCVTETESRKLKAGEVIIHSPNTSHNTICNGKTSATMFNVLFYCDSPEIECLKDKTLSVPEVAIGTFKDFMNECAATYKTSSYPIIVRDDAPFGGIQMARILLEKFFLMLIREIDKMCIRSAPISQSADTGRGIVDEICDYMQQNIYGRLTLDDLTEKFHFGKSFLCAQFKKITGSSPINFYLDLKLTEAKRLLREDDLTVTEIAEMLGFESHEYFSRYFKKRVGHSPRDFKKLLISDAALRKKQ